MKPLSDWSWAWSLHLPHPAIDPQPHTGPEGHHTGMNFQQSAGLLTSWKPLVPSVLPELFSETP